MIAKISGPDECLHIFSANDSLVLKGFHKSMCVFIGDSSSGLVQIITQFAAQVFLHSDFDLADVAVRCGVLDRRGQCTSSGRCIVGLRSTFRWWHLDGSLEMSI